MESGFLATATALLAATIRMSTPLTLAGIGETYSEKSGILNIGLEGIMLSGAFFSFITAYYIQSIALGVAGGCLGGIFIAMIHGYLRIRMVFEQIRPAQSVTIEIVQGDFVQINKAPV